MTLWWELLLLLYSISSFVSGYCTCLITLPNKLGILVGEDCVVIFTSDTVFRVGETTQYKIMAYFLTDSSTPNRVLNGTYWVIAQWSEHWQLKPRGWVCSVTASTWVWLILSDFISYHQYAFIIVLWQLSHTKHGGYTSFGWSRIWLKPELHLESLCYPN